MTDSEKSRRETPKGRRTMTVPVAEEFLDIAEQTHVTGRVRVATRTETVERTVEEALRSVGAEVTRTPIDRFLEPGTPMPQVRTEGEVTVVPVIEEVLIVEKRLKLVEEVRIAMTTSEETVSVPVSLRKQHAVVERLPASEPIEKD